MALHMAQVALGHSAPIYWLSWQVCGLSKHRKKEIGYGFRCMHAQWHPFESCCQSHWVLQRCV